MRVPRQIIFTILIYHPPIETALSDYNNQIIKYLKFNNSLEILAANSENYPTMLLNMMASFLFLHGL
jgi:hypothetical protein